MNKSKRIISVALALIIAAGMMAVSATSFEAVVLGPTTLYTPTFNSNATVTLKWKAASGANRYQLAKKKKTDSKYTYIDLNNVTSYTDKDVTCGTVYYYQVKPMYVTNYGVSNGVWSNTQSVTTLYRPTITSMNFMGILQGNILNINWNKIKGVSKYKVAFRRTTDKLWNYRVVTSNYYNVLNPTNGAKYVAQVCPMNGSIAGQWSAGKIANPNALAKPVINSVGKVAWWDDVLVISWSISTPAERFTLYYKRAQDSDWSTISTSSISATLGDFDKTAVYYFQVQAHGQDGEKSPFSAVKTFTLLDG